MRIVYAFCVMPFKCTSCKCRTHICIESDSTKCEKAKKMSACKYYASADALPKSAYIYIYNNSIVASGPENRSHISFVRNLMLRGKFLFKSIQITLSLSRTRHTRFDQILHMCFFSCGLFLGKTLSLAFWIIQLGAFFLSVFG